MATKTAQRKRKRKELSRPPRGKGRIIAGVCAGLADRFGLPRGMVRLAFLIFGLVGAGEIVYVIAWIVMPTGRR